ncbi:MULTISPECIES: ArsR/SmtB family transcription factor [Pseudonocardia]|uniref:Cadmium resistance transcriptional regulatory protein CadC n=2 Tax=Pseudonocardia TaxID=1847 RepID=A0A1Y2N8W7_PSEAH|nr:MULTISPECIES: metalloregulator ArsR/SmtB family transcription factor [Pseudonocardia]OSY43906.1 Cadmium resistance transcriptional regulatory protein CadC [Pseudonocardia autotrophica]TDN74360.1 DNA-binding transcriptional ArsR family regulator [Pseudonocardia autotrophica]BBG05125.1 transcriptional regulator [Pseudonocardia autotrophica]GEC27920.1 transcriptional regulator [Pseudonocardia saturnea]
MPADDRCELLCLDLPRAELIRAQLPGAAGLEPAAGVARGLGDPTRLRIAMALLTGHELCVCDTAWIVGGSQALVSHHLRQLRGAGVVTSRKDGRMVMYRLSGRGVTVLGALLDLDEDVPADGGDRA